MARHRKLWLGLALLAIGGAIAVSWRIRSSSDVDFPCIGPKTSAVRSILDALDETVDPGEFPNDVKLRTILDLLGEKIEARGKNLAVLVKVDAFMAKDLGPEPYELEVHYPPEVGPITVKEFLRLTFAQIDRRDVVFVLRQQSFIEVTTIEDAELQKDRYLTFNRVGPFDRVIQTWLECFGSDGFLPHAPHGIK